MNPRAGIFIGLAIVGFAIASLLAESPDMQLHWLVAALGTSLLVVVDVILRACRTSRKRRTNAVGRRGPVDMSDIKAELAKPPPSASPMLPDNVEHPDPLARDVIARAFNSGGIVIGRRDEQGKETIEGPGA